MVDLIDYELRGDLDARFELTNTHERAQWDAVRLHGTRCVVPGLTWEAHVAGESCPGWVCLTATIVDGVAIGLVEQSTGATQRVRAARAQRPSGVRKPTRGELEAKVRELEAQIERLRGS